MQVPKAVPPSTQHRKPLVTCPTWDTQVTTHYSHQTLTVGHPRPWWWHELSDLEHCLLPCGPLPPPPPRELHAEHSAGRSGHPEKEVKGKWSTASIPRCQGARSSWDGNLFLEMIWVEVQSKAALWVETSVQSGILTGDPRGVSPKAQRMEVTALIKGRPQLCSYKLSVYPLCCLSSQSTQQGGTRREAYLGLGNLIQEGIPKASQPASN